MSNFLGLKYSVYSNKFIIMSDKEIHLASTSTTVGNKVKKRGWRNFLIIAVMLIAFFISPLPRFFVSKIPDSIIKSVIAPIYKEVVLSETAQRLSEPKKYEYTKPLPILGRDTGVCFTFDQGSISDKEVRQAKQNKKIAEIIVLSMQNKKYILDNISVDKAKNAKNTYLICQKFGLRDSILPEQVRAVYIRPITPLSPSKITWATMAEFL